MNKQAYIELNGFNTWKDFQLRMTERIVDPPFSKTNRTDLPRSHGTLDLSRGLRDEIYYEDRQIHYTFKRVIASREERLRLKFRLEQAFSRYTEGILIDSLEEFYQYRNVMVIETHFSDMKNPAFIFQVDFMAHPFKRHIYAEGEDVWDAFDFELDVVQDRAFKLPSILDQVNFLPLEIGDMVTLGGWSQYSAGSGTLLSNFETERYYEVMDMRDNNDTDYSKLIYSGIQYRLDDGIWYRAQDIVQARPLRYNINLMNTGTKSVIPEIIMETDSGSLGGITIEMNNEFYNFRSIQSRGILDFNDKLALQIGNNNMKIYGQGTLVTFKWYREVI